MTRKATPLRRANGSARQGGRLALHALIGLGLCLATPSAQAVGHVPVTGASDSSGPATIGTFPTDSSTDVPHVRVRHTVLTPDSPDVPSLAPPTGFGAETTGGTAGRVLHVSSSEDSLIKPAPGTLRWALGQAGRKWIVFDRDVTIVFKGPMHVGSNTTIDGRGRNVTFTGHGTGGLWIYDARNVIVVNVTMHDFGDTAKTIMDDPWDDIDIQRSSRVWIDHCSLSHAGDKAISIEGGGQEITFSWNHFFDQEQTVQIGAMSTAMQDVDSTVTLHHNYFDHVGYRTPLVLYGHAHVYNNYIDSWQVSGVRSERLAQVLLQQNVFRVAGSRRASTITPAQLWNDAHTLYDDRPGYLYDDGNIYLGKVERADTGPTHVFNPGTSALATVEPASLAMADRISSSAGARPGASPVAATLGAELSANNSSRGNDVLRLSVTDPSYANGAASIFRETQSGWSRLGSVNLSPAARRTYVVKDSDRRHASTYLAVVSAPGMGAHVTSNTARLR